MFRSRKSQTSLFMIIGVLMLIIFGLTYTLKHQTNANPELDVQSFPLESYLQSCFQNEFEFALHSVMYQGGYYDEESFLAVPYYYDVGEIDVPTSEEVESSISESLKYPIIACIELYPLNVDINYDVDLMEVETNIGQEDVSSFISMPIEVVSGDTRTTLEDFVVSTDSNLKEMHDTANLITIVQKQSGEDICITCVSEFIQDLDFETSIIEFVEEDLTAYVVYSFNDTKQNFNFIHRFNISEE